MSAKELERPCTVNSESGLRTGREDATVSVESGIKYENWCSRADMVSSEVHSGDGERQARAGEDRGRRKDAIRQPDMGAREIDVGSRSGAGPTLDIDNDELDVHSHRVVAVCPRCKHLRVLRAARETERETNQLSRGRMHSSAVVL